MGWNGSGTYNLPAGQPVVTGTVIQSSTFNAYTTDVANTFNNVLPRDGQAPMTAALKLIDGSVTVPGLAFNSEPSTGLYRPGSGLIAATVSGVESLRMKSTGEVAIGTTSFDGTNKLQVTGGVKITGAFEGTSTGKFGGAFEGTTTGKFGGGAASNTSKLMVNTPNGTAAGLQLFQDGVESWIIGMDASTSTLKFANSGTTRMSIGQGGNVTINTPSSGSALTVNTLTSNYALYASDGTATSFLYLAGASGATAGTLTNHQYVIQTNNTPRLSVAAGGNVTIAQPGSGTALSVTGVAGAARIALLNGSYTEYQLASVTYGYLGDRTGVLGSGAGMTLRSEGAFYLSTNGATERVVVSSAGNVTVNAPSSGYALTLANVSGTSAIRINGTGGTNTAAGSYVSINDTGTSTNRLMLAVNSTAAYIYAGGSVSNPDIIVANNDGSIEIARFIAGGGMQVGQGGGVATKIRTQAWSNYYTEWGHDTFYSGYVNVVENGSAGQFRLLRNGTPVLTTSTSGNVTIAAPSSGVGLTVSGGGITVSSGGISVTGASVLTGAVSGVTTLNASGAATFSSTVDFTTSGNLRISGGITRFESSEQACPTASSTTNVAHGGARIPDIFNVVFRCKTAEWGYSIGDEISYGSMSEFSGSNGIWTACADATNISFVWIRSGNPFVPHKSSWTAQVMTAANWKMVFRAIWL